MEKDKTDDFRGLLYNPIFEHEVEVLFGLIMPKLEKHRFAIEEYSGGFPDCFALCDGKRIGIEFEVDASKFKVHKKSKKWRDCSMIVCWNNDMRDTSYRKDGKWFCMVNGSETEKREIEILELKEEVAELKKKGNKFILDGERLIKYDDFFKQLKGEGAESYGLVKELYEEVKKNESFEIKWGHGKRMRTMRFFVKEWGVSPIDILGNGSAEISYHENMAFLRWWKLPTKTETELQKIFNSSKKNWFDVPLNDRTDIEKIQKALKVLEEQSKIENLIWNTKT